MGRGSAAASVLVVEGIEVAAGRNGRGRRDEDEPG